MGLGGALGWRLSVACCLLGCHGSRTLLAGIGSRFGSGKADTAAARPVSAGGAVSAVCISWPVPAFSAGGFSTRLGRGSAGHATAGLFTSCGFRDGSADPLSEMSAVGSEFALATDPLDITWGTDPCSDRRRSPAKSCGGASAASSSEIGDIYVSAAVPAPPAGEDA